MLRSTGLRTVYTPLQLHCPRIVSKARYFMLSVHLFMFVPDTVHHYTYIQERLNTPGVLPFLSPCLQLFFFINDKPRHPL